MIFLKIEDFFYCLFGVDFGINILGYVIFDIKGCKMVFCDMGVIYLGKFNIY